jgi:hypothetical protein
MTNLKDGLLVVAVDERWIELPATQDDADARIAEIIGTFDVDAEAAARLDYSLRTVLAVAFALPAGARRSYALITDATSGVQALLSMRVSRVAPEAYDDYLATATRLESNDELELIHRTVDEVVLPAGRGVLSRDFTLPKTTEGVPDPAMERTFLALFPTDADTAVEFTLLTQNLALFENAGDYLLALAANENPSTSETRLQ